MSRTRRTLLVGGLIAVCAIVVGCSDTAVADQDAAVTTGDAPAFTGPFAAEFAAAYGSASSDFVRGALADEQISDAEYAEMTEGFRRCLADAGIEFGGFDAAGGYTTSIAPGGGDTHAIVSECVSSSGQDAIGMLRDVMAVNPQNLDVPTMMAECLVREGAVPPGYRAEDYVQDSSGRFADPSGLSPELVDSLTACSADPLDILGE